MAKSPSPFQIDTRKEEISVAGRSFELEEQSAAEVEDYLEMQVSLTKRTLDDLAASNEGANISRVAASLLRNNCALVCQLLSRPTDGQERPDVEWVRRKLGPSQLRAVMSKQDELNSVEELLGNAVVLLDAATRRTDDEETPTSPGPAAAETSDSTSGSAPSGSTAPTPDVSS